MAMMKYIDKGNFVLLSLALALAALSLSGNSGSEAVSVDTRSLSGGWYVELMICVGRL